MENEQEQFIWELWSGVYPLMTAGFVAFRSYEEFKRETLRPRIKYSNKSYEEIEREMLAVVAAHEGR